MLIPRSNKAKTVREGREERKKRSSLFASFASFADKLLFGRTRTRDFGFRRNDERSGVSIASVDAKGKAVRKEREERKKRNFLFASFASFADKLLLSLADELFCVGLAEI